MAFGSIVGDFVVDFEVAGVGEEVDVGELGALWLLAEDFDEGDVGFGVHFVRCETVVAADFTA